MHVSFLILVLKYARNWPHMTHLTAYKVLSHDSLSHSQWYLFIVKVLPSPQPRSRQTLKTTTPS